MKQAHCSGGVLVPDSDYEILHAPIVLAKGDVLRQRKLKLADDFAWDTRLAAIYGDAPGIVIEDVELVGDMKWQQRWFAPTEKGAPYLPGIPTELVGIRLQGCPGLRMERVKVSGVPRAGVECFGIGDGLLSNLSFERCFQGLNIRGYAPNRRVRVETIRVHDTWGPPHGGGWPGIGGPPSARPGEFMGSDGMTAGNLVDSSIHDVRVTGEQLLGIKMGGGSRNVVVSAFVGVGFMVQGTAAREGKPDEHTVGITLRDSVIDKSYGAGDHVNGGNACQVSFNVHDFQLLDSQLRCQEGKGGNAIEFWGNVHGEVRGCTISGFNGMRGKHPARALSVGDASSANEDFSTANRFVNQDRITPDATAAT